MLCGRVALHRALSSWLLYAADHAPVQMTTKYDVQCDSICFIT